MKKTQLLHAELSRLIAQLGHGDTICIADSGLPIPEAVRRIELALTAGVPSFEETLSAILSEFHIEAAVAAEETKQVTLAWKSLAGKNMQFADWMLKTLPAPVTFVSHEEFKKQTLRTRAIIRTGEQTPFANVILRSGVVY